MIVCLAHRVAKVKRVVLSSTSEESSLHYVIPRSLRGSGTKLQNDMKDSKNIHILLVVVTRYMH